MAFDFSDTKPGFKAAQKKPTQNTNPPETKPPTQAKPPEKTKKAPKTAPQPKPTQPVKPSPAQKGCITITLSVNAERSVYRNLVL